MLSLCTVKKKMVYSLIQTIKVASDLHSAFSRSNHSLVTTLSLNIDNDTSHFESLGKNLNFIHRNPEIGNNVLTVKLSPIFHPACVCLHLSGICRFLH